MRVGLVAWMGAAVVLLGGSNAVAQERGQFGLTMGYPAAIGVVWHATDRVGIKGEFTFALSSSEFDASPLLSGRETHTDSFGIGIAGLFYVSRNDNVSTYFSPRFAYAKGHIGVRRTGFLHYPAGAPSLSHTEPGHPQRIIELFVRWIVRCPVFTEPAVQRVRRARTQLFLAADRIVAFILDQDRRFDVRRPVGSGRHPVLQLTRLTPEC